jgi:glycosyltransferase involved in cell wall biosynthesis
MKIAMITAGYYPVLDGVTVSVHNRIKRLSRLGHEVLVICPDYSDVKVYENAQAHSGNIMKGVYVANVPSEGFMGLDFEKNICAAAAGRIDRELEKFKPDIIHVDEPERIWMGLYRRAGFGYAKRNGIPCVAMFHTNYIEYAEDFIKNVPAVIMSLLKRGFKKLLNFIYNGYSMTIVPGKVTHDKVLGFGIENARFEDVNGIDWSFLALAPHYDDYFKEKYNLEGLKDKTKLIFIGRLTEDKNWHFTLSALPELLQRVDRSKIEIFIAGDGPMKEEIGNSLCRFSPYIHLLGRLPQEELYMLLSNCDVHISASLKENRCVTCLEAMACGVPMLAPRAGGFIDDIKDEYNGYLFNPDDKEDFIAKCRLIIENTDLRKRMSSNCREYAKRFDWDKCIEKLLSIWNDCINRIKSAS